MKKEQRILIIDGDFQSCEGIAHALTAHGVDVCYIHSIVEATDCLLWHTFRLVIMDIALLETDGLQLLRFMRQMQDVPMLVLASREGRLLMHESLCGYVCGDDLVDDENNDIPVSLRRLWQELEADIKQETKH